MSRRDHSTACYFVRALRLLSLLSAPTLWALWLVNYKEDATATISCHFLTASPLTTNHLVSHLQLYIAPDMVSYRVAGKSTKPSRRCSCGSCRGRIWELQADFKRHQRGERPMCVRFPLPFRSMSSRRNPIVASGALTQGLTATHALTVFLRPKRP